MEVHRPTDRCEATTTIMQHHDIRCDLPAGHQGNHHAHVVGHELYLDKDGHTIKARSWQLEWRPQPSAEC